MIRQARLQDLNALMAIEQSCFTVNLLSVRSMRYMLCNDKARVLVYEENDILCGYILTFCHPRSKLARHYSLAVLAQHRKRGIAEALLGAMEKQCGKLGVKLEIHEHNKAAMGLYQRLGYHIIRRREGFYDDGAAALEMVKML